MENTKLILSRRLIIRKFEKKKEIELEDKIKNFFISQI